MSQAMTPATNSEPIRLTHCIGTMRLGGAEKQLAELIVRLPRDRYRQTLVLLQGGGPLIARVRDAGCEVIELGYSMKYRVMDPRCYGAMGHAVGRMIRHLRGSRTQILHGQLFWANVLSVGAGRLAGTPVVLTSRLQLSDYKQGRPNLQRIENFANRFTTGVFVNSEAVRRDALAREQNLEGKTRLIYNGVVLEDFAEGAPDSGATHADRAAIRAELGLAPDDIAVIAVANLHPYKGHEDLIRAVAMLRAGTLSLSPSAASAGARIRLFLPGRDQGARARLEAVIAELGMAGAATLMGERADIPRLLQAADIVVHPSHQEGFSNAILEAMTAGKPLVVTNVGGNPEAVRDGVNGLVVPARDPDALAAAVGRLAASPELRAQMGAASRRRIEIEFSMTRMIAEFDEWYQQLAAGIPPRSRRPI